ncbi:MAG TPA: transcriptional regulator, partial [Roseateles sp.]
MESPVIRHHPTDDVLLSYAGGSLATGMRAVVAVHLELCPECRERVAQLRAVGGALLDDEPP